MLTEPAEQQGNNTPTTRRQLLLQTASELFARKGIDAVSLNEINKAAGQRNTSATHYHFGNKDGLLQAIIYEHYAAIDQQINDMLDAWEARPAASRTARDLLACLVIPFARQLDTPEGINYLLIVRQVLIKSSDLLLIGHPEGEDRARLRVFELFREQLADLPREIRTARLIVNAGTLFNSLATYARGAQEGADFITTNQALFINNLLDVMESLISAPPSPATLASLPPDAGG